jgi:hypothetical protein
VKEETAEALANAVLQDDLMNQTAVYLGRGRQFEGHPLEELHEKWTLAIRKWSTAGYGTLPELDDLSAELRLREAKEPWDRVPEVRAQMNKEIARSGPYNPGVRAKINEFLEAIDKPQN